ncbi:response regulator transcription factor [Arthrobacter sp. FW306-06-A]|uniref:response regulator transcription factor n=1 Tax=Arthrobacter sp. FW306-06-A TaxID=2879621 RepID=UPI001F01CD89|nr:response regulator [Arthrobacter sp. FW306-06-A]UKA70923.1 response regulator [Arthrobacter sp. FW306-06-A]
MEEERVCLVIEDDPDIRGLITAVLAGAGFAVLTAGSGAEGIAACAAAGPALSLITLDLGLPDNDGHDVAQALRALSSAPLLFLTARAGEDDILSGLAAGAAAYLTKPFRPSRLRETALSLSRLQAGSPAPEAAT